MPINAKTKDRISKKLKRYQNIVTKALEDDVNESDTVTIITDILCEILGFDKYENLTSEYAIRKTFCDLAIKLGSRVPLLIECKAVGIDLKEDHIRQATNYAAESGTEWVVLTNAKDWKIYKVTFTQPIDKQLIYEFNLLDLSARRPESFEVLYPLCIESFIKGIPAGLDAVYEKKQVLNRYVVGQLLVSEDVLGALRRKFKKLFPDIKIDVDILEKMLKSEVIKRDVLEEDVAKDAAKLIRKAERKAAPKPAKKEET